MIRLTAINDLVVMESKKPFRSLDWKRIVQQLPDSHIEYWPLTRIRAQIDAGDETPLCADLLAVKAFGPHIHLLDVDVIEDMVDQEFWGLISRDWLEAAGVYYKHRSFYIKRMKVTRANDKPDDYQVTLLTWILMGAMHLQQLWAHTFVFSRLSQMIWMTLLTFTATAW